MDHDHNMPGTPYLSVDADRRTGETQRMDQAPYELDASRREVVLAAIRQDCEHRGWTLHAAHIRSNHVHVVISADAPPERVMNDLKSYVSRRLNERGMDSPVRKRWTRHGSTRYLWKEEAVLAAMDYVVYRQGETMHVYVGIP